MSVPRTVVDDATRNALLGLAVGDADVLREAVDIREAEQQSSAAKYCDRSEDLGTDLDT